MLLKLCKFVKLEMVVVLRIKIFEKFGYNRRGSHFKNFVIERFLYYCTESEYYSLSMD